MDPRLKASLLRAFAIAFAFFPALAPAADNASRCVKLGKLMNAGTVQKFNNVCDFEVMMYWCNAPDGCGDDPDFHPYFGTYEVMSPEGSTIVRAIDPAQEYHIAACRAFDKDGTWLNPVPVMLDANGAYRCEPQR